MQRLWAAFLGGGRMAVLRTSHPSLRALLLHAPFNARSFNSVDNGYLSFDHMRIPRDAMLMRFAQVTEVRPAGNMALGGASLQRSGGGGCRLLPHRPTSALSPRPTALQDGSYVPPPPDNQKAAYATMVYVRATIVRDSGDFLSERGWGRVGWVGRPGAASAAGARPGLHARCGRRPARHSQPSAQLALRLPPFHPTPPSPGRAVTIATRYCAVRRQTATKLGEPELQVGVGGAGRSCRAGRGRAGAAGQLAARAPCGTADSSSSADASLSHPVPPATPPTIHPCDPGAGLRQRAADPDPAAGPRLRTGLHGAPGLHAVGQMRDFLWAHGLEGCRRRAGSCPPATPPLAATSSSQGRSMMAMYESFDAARARGDFAVLPELHALSSGLKALCTDVAAGGIEACRRQCGGHGYMLASGLPTLFNSYVQNVTWEGENSGAPWVGICLWGGRGS